MEKTILITGSSRGIGKAIATLAHKKGYKVILHASRDSEDLKKTHQNLKGSLKIFFDVSDKDQAQNEINKILKRTKIDILVNNAGIILNTPKEINEVDDNKSIQEWKVNVLGPIHCIQAVLPSMLKNHKGCIINIASIKGHQNYSTFSSFTYGQTKAAVISLTKSLAKKYSPQGIRFNSISPGYVITDMSKSWTKETWEKVNSGILIERVAKPEEIAPLVLFLASDESSYITGSDIVIDGGFSLKGK